MAVWTSEQETLIAAIIGPELSKRFDNNQAGTVARLFDPATPTLAKQLLVQKLNALKVANQATLADLPAQVQRSTAALNAEIALIDSVLTTLV